jgi:hypothetical protein
MAFFEDIADYWTKLAKDVHCEAAYPEKVAYASWESGCRLVRCGESHGALWYLRVLPDSSRLYSLDPLQMRYWFVQKVQHGNQVVENHSCLHMHLHFHLHLSHILHVYFHFCSLIFPVRTACLAPLYSLPNYVHGLFLFRVAGIGCWAVGRWDRLVHLF